MIAELFSGERDWSDVLLLVAVIAAVLAAVGSFGTNALSKYASTLLATAVAAVAFGLLLL